MSGVWANTSPVKAKRRCRSGLRVTVDWIVADVDSIVVRVVAIVDDGTAPGRLLPAHAPTTENTQMTRSDRRSGDGR